MSGRMKGTALTGAQLILVVAVLARVSRDVLHPGALAGVVGALALTAWAVMSMGIFRVRVRPEPAADARLCTRGPYRWIRHPMYAAVLVLTLSVLLSNPAWWAAACWGALCAVLWLKLRHEEARWLELNDEYAGYMERTKRLVPWIL